MKRLIVLMMSVLLVACGGDDFFTSKPADVRNSKNDNWKVATISESIDIKEKATEYVEKYMEDGEVHFIIDFNKNNTYQLNKYGETINLAIFEYVDKEEHDASTIGSGMLLGEYVIDSDGNVEEIKE